uniref:uncharacterized protein LOC120344279 isoform X1 n=1 Tax=Styela clava TaxID=7725 RepID=UPI001939DF51|nr:uncharacterized protein LOC120344279 isoform X1 [Styela clava]
MIASLIKCILLLLMLLLPSSFSMNCMSGKGNICTCKQRRGIPWSIPTDRTAPAVHNVNARFFVESERIGIKVKWSYRVTYLPDISGGFLIEVLYSKGDPKYYHCNVTVQRTRSKKPSITFQFIYGTGTVRPKDEFLFKISSLPLYTFDSKPSSESVTLLVKGCKHKDISRTIYCKRDRKKVSIRIDENPVHDQTIFDQRIFVTLFVLCAILITLLIFYFLAIICICNKPGFPTLTRVNPRTILIVGNVDNERKILLTNGLYNVLRSNGGNNVYTISNVQNMNAIGQEGITVWLSKKMSTSDVCIFLTDNDLTNDNSHVNIAIGLAKSMILKKHHIRATRKKIILAHWNNTIHHDNIENLVFCQHYHLITDIKKLLKHALGEHFYCTPQNCDDSKELLCRLLSTLPQSESIISNVANINDLSNTDVIEICEEEETMNILNLDELPSIECNT